MCILKYDYVQILCVLFLVHAYVLSMPCSSIWLWTLIYTDITAILTS